MSSAILLVILLTGSLNLTVNIEAQRSIWFILPLFPVFIIFFIGSVAETNRAPFDLAEAESELVSGFMTEHAAVIFVFFFLAEYASIVLICILNTMLFFAGYSIDFSYIMYMFNYLFYGLSYVFTFDPLISIAEVEREVFNFLSLPFIEGMIDGLTIGIKSCISIVFYPQIDRQTERLNQTLEIYLQAFMNYKITNWKDLLLTIEFAYNNTTSTAIGITPFFANYRYHPAAYNLLQGNP